MARKGLGKGLDSLIPDIYDKDFDSNSPKSLEDILNDVSEETNDADSSTEEKVDSEETITEEKVDSEETTKEEVKDESDKTITDSDVEEDNTNSNGIEEVEEEISVEEKTEEPSKDEKSSEDLSGDENGEEIIQTPQEIKIQKEHVDEVKKIVDKNPRITLWSSRSSAVFRYLRKTEPEFSISKEASVLIEEAVSKKYPEIWALFEDE